LRSPHERPAFARYTSYGGFESTEARSAKAEATCGIPGCRADALIRATGYTRALSAAV